MGHYTFNYLIVLKNYAMLTTDRVGGSFKVSIYDPCVILRPELRPAQCSGQEFLKDSMPTWMTKLPDSVLIQYGQNYKIEMGPAVDNFGQTVRVSVKTNENSIKSNLINYKTLVD